MQEVKSGFRLRGNDMKTCYHLAPKAKISESGDYNLTGDRYRESIVHVHKDWPMVELGKVQRASKGNINNKGSSHRWEHPRYCS